VRDGMEFNFLNSSKFSFSIHKQFNGISVAEGFYLNGFSLRLPYINEIFAFQTFSCGSYVQF
jgi:hypothetical protein